MIVRQLANVLRHHVVLDMNKFFQSLCLVFGMLVLFIGCFSSKTSNTYDVINTDLVDSEEIIIAEPISVITPVSVKSTQIPFPEVSYGGVLHIVSRESATHQDIHQEVSPSLSTWGPGIVYSRMMRFISGSDVSLPSLALECELCETWILENEREYLFELRSGVHWQDIYPLDGRELNSSDILFSYDRQSQPGWPNAQLLSAVKSVSAPSVSTVRVVVQEPDADFLLSLADGHSKIITEDAVDVYGDLKNGPTVGTDAWILTETRPKAAHMFEKNIDYFEEGFPFVDKLFIYIIADSATRDAAFKVGSIDVMEIDYSQWDELYEKKPEISSLMTHNVGGGVEVAMKTSTPPFDDIRVRKAVFHSMNLLDASRDIWLQSNNVSSGFPNFENGWVLNENELKEYFGNFEFAKDLMFETGAELPISVEIKVGDFGEMYLAYAEYLSTELNRVGFDTHLELVNRKQFGKEVWLGGDYQMFVGPTPPVLSPNGYLMSVLHTLGEFNTTGHVDEELDYLIETQSQEFDLVKRREVMLEIQRHVLNNAYRFMPITGKSMWVWWPRVNNFYPNFAGFEYSHWSRIWLDD